LKLASKAIAELERLPFLRLVEMDNQFIREAARLAGRLNLRGADAPTLRRLPAHTSP